MFRLDERPGEMDWQQEYMMNGKTVSNNLKFLMPEEK